MLMEKTDKEFMDEFLKALLQESQRELKKKTEEISEETPGRIQDVYGVVSVFFGAHS